MKKLLAVMGLGLVASTLFGEIYYGNSCNLDDATGWYKESGFTTLCGVAPGPGVTNIIQTNKSTVKVNKSHATYTGELLILGNANANKASRGTISTEAITLTIPNCLLRSSRININSGGTLTVKGRFEVTPTSLDASYVPQFCSMYTDATTTRNVTLDATFVSGTDGRLRLVAGYNDGTAIDAITLSGDFSGYQGELLCDSPCDGNLANILPDRQVRVYFKSESSMGDANAELATAVLVRHGVILEIDPAVTQSAARGITFDLAEGEKVYVGTTKVDNWTLSAPCTGGTDATLEKIDAGTVTLDTAIPMKAVEVAEGTLNLGSGVSFAAGTTIHVCLGAKLTGTVPAGVVVNDDNTQKGDIVWTGLGGNEYATTAQNWEGDTVGDYTSGTKTLIVKGGTGIDFADSAASLGKVDLSQLPVDSTGFRFAGTESMTVGTEGVAVPSAVATARTYAFDIPTTFNSDIDWKLGALTTLRLGGAVTVPAQNGLFFAAPSVDEPGALVEIQASNSDYKGGFSTTNCRVVVSCATSPFGTGAGNAVVAATESANEYWWTGGDDSPSLLTLKAPGCTINRGFRFYTTVANVHPLRLLDAEAGSTNEFDKAVQFGRGTGAMLYVMRFGANSYAKISSLSTKFNNAIKLYGPGEVEFGDWEYVHAYKSGKSYRYFQILDNLTVTLSGKTTEFATITVSEGATLRLANEASLNVKDVLFSDDTKQGTNVWLEVEGTLDLCGIDHPLYGLTSTGKVVSTGAPAKIFASYVSSLACGLDFGAGVSLSVTNGTYRLTGSSASDGVLEVAETGALVLEKGCEWPNGTLSVPAGESVELGTGAHRFDKLVVNGQELPPGVYGARYANPLTDGAFTGPGRLYIGGCSAGALLIFR